MILFHGEQNWAKRVSSFTQTTLVWGKEVCVWAAILHFPLLFLLRHSQVLIVPVITHRSHDFTGVPVSRCRSGRPAVLPPCERRGAEAEALKGAQQVEAFVLGFAFRMNNLRQLAGERHFPSNWPQMVRVLRVLNHDGKNRRERWLNCWTFDQTNASHSQSLLYLKICFKPNLEVDSLKCTLWHTMTDFLCTEVLYKQERHQLHVRQFMTE